MKIAKVIATCFRRGRVRKETKLTGDPLGYFNHSQNFITEDQTIDLLNYQIQMEKVFSPGVERDLIIANSDIGFDKGNKFINSLNNKPIPGGKIISFTRKDFGMAFGCFNDTFLAFRNNYDYFFFIEDDQITAKKNYLKIGLDKFISSKKYGFIAYIGLSKVAKYWWEKANLNKNNAIVAYGGCGLSSTKILNEIVNKNGSLPHAKCGNDHTETIAKGEIGFSKSFIDLGYELTEFKNEILVIPAYDLMRGINYKKYPNLYEKLFFLFKSYLYNLFSKNQFILKYYLIFLAMIKKIFNFFKK
jgi:hypothetical protein